MDNNKSIELIQRIKTEIKSLVYGQDEKVKNLKKRLELVITKNFGAGSRYLNDVKAISFESEFYLGNAFANSIWNNGKDKLLGLITIIEEDIELSEIGAHQKSTHEVLSSSELNKNVFIVHGHNEEMKQSVARTVEKLSLNPIILHEQANKGRTIIEKFSDHSNVLFAIVLLSADDIGYPKSKKLEEAKLRARQNVIFELGFFLGKLGRQNVFTLFEVNDNFEFPSDYSGVIFTPYDKDGNWKFSLVKELSATGFKVDANKII